MLTPKDYQTLISCHFFHCSKRYFQNLTKELRAIISPHQREKVFGSSRQSETIVFQKPKTGEQILITLKASPPRKEDQYFQVGIPSFQIKIAGYVKKGTPLSSLLSEINQFVESASLVFSDSEQEKIEEYTPVLKDLVEQAYPKSKILEDSIVIFREHSLLSVLTLRKC